MTMPIPRTVSEVEESKPSEISDWDGPEDKANPYNWSLPWRVYHTIIPTSIAFLCPFGSSVYTPAHDQIMSVFGVSRELSLLPFSLYFLGLALGPIIAAPISETFGRKVVYLSGLPIFAAFTIGAGFSNDIASLTVCRFFAGVFSSPGLSIGPGSISDIWPPERRNAPMSVFVSMVQIGPAIAPLIGGYVTIKLSWRWTQWVILFGLAGILLMTTFMSETYKPVILQKRAKALGTTGPQGEDWTVASTVRFFVTKTIVRPVLMFLTEPIVTFLDIYVAFNFGLFNAFFAAFAWVFQTVYGFDVGLTGLTYLGELVGTLVALSIMLYVSCILWPRKEQKFLQNHHHSLPPEHQLIYAKLGAPLLPISLFWFGWTARPSVLWISPVIAEAFFCCGNLLIFTCASLYLTDCYGADYGASAWASTTSLRYLFSTVTPLFAIQMYEGLGVGWATSLLGFVSLLLVPIPFVFSMYGNSLRSKSSYTSASE